MSATLKDLLAALNHANGNEKVADEKQGQGGMPPAETLHKSPMGQPTGPQHELEAVLGPGPEDRRAVLKDQLLEAAGSANTQMSRQDPDETHNVSIESKADELMPPAGNAGGEYQGPMTAESKISADAEQLASEFEYLADVAAESGDSENASKLAARAADYKAMAKDYKGGKTPKGKMPPDYKEMPKGKKAADLVNQILGRTIEQDKEAVKAAEDEETDHLLKVATEYYHAGRIFGKGAIDAMRESVAEENKGNSEEKVADDRFSALEEKVDALVDFNMHLAEMMGSEE